MTLTSCRQAICACIFACMWASTASLQDTSVQLKAGSPRLVTIPANSTVEVTVPEVESTVQFLVIQVHTLHIPLTLQAATPQTLSPTAISGSSVGMVTMVPGITTVSWNIRVAEADYHENVTAMVNLQAYGENAPVPGGCNQVFELETDPNILLFPSDYQTTVWFQWASPGSPLGAGCDKTDKNFRDFTYDLYVSYVTEGDVGQEALFDALFGMASVKAIEENAHKFMSLTNDGVKKSKVTVASQRRQGALYTIVVRDSKYAASYVTSVTYACDFTTGECDVKMEALDIIFTIVCAAVGIFLLFCGHEFLKTELAVFGFISFTLATFLLLSLTDSLSDAASLGIAAVLGVLGALLSLLLWQWMAFPSLSVLLPGLTAGYILASVIFFTPFANLSWWDSSLNYGLVFTCVCLLFVVILLCSPLTLNIVSCALVGSYCLVLAVAIPLHSSLKMIFLNSVRHATVPGYIQTTVVAPFLTKDIILAVAWGVLLIVGAAFQFYFRRGKPAFPVPGRRRLMPRRRQGQQSERPSTPLPDETAPLLANQERPLPSYMGATQKPPESSERCRPT